MDNGGADEFTVTIAGEAVGVDGQPATLRVKASGMRTSGENAALGALTTGGVQGDGTTQLTLVGTITEIEAVLGMDDLLEYRGSEDWHGEERVLLVVCDDDATSMACSSSGAGGSVVEFTVDAVADEPEVEVGDATDLTYTESTDASAREIDVGGSATFVVSDAESATLDVTVEVFVRDDGGSGGSSGVPATGFGSVTVTVDGSLTTVSSTSTDMERVVLNGESGELTSVLSTLTLTFAAFYDESVTVVVTAVDQATMSGSGSVDIVVTPVNDRPMVTFGAMTINALDYPEEEAVLDIGSLTQVTIEDVEGDDVHVTVTSVMGLGTLLLTDSGVAATVTAVPDGLNIAGSAEDVSFALVLLRYQGGQFENGAEIVRYVVCDGDVADACGDCGCLGDVDVAFTITSVETGPSVTFDVYTVGSTISMAEGATGTTVDLGATAVGAVVDDDEDVDVTVTVTLSNSLWSVDVAAGSSVPGTISPGGLGTDVVTLVGTITDVNAVLDVLELNVPNQGFGSSSVAYMGVDDSGNDGVEAIVQVAVTEIQDAPVVSVALGGTGSVMEDAVYSTLGGDLTVSVSDVDTTTLTGTFSVTNGVLTVADASNGDAAVSGASVVVSGTAAQLVTTLSSAAYLNDLNYHGGETLTVVIGDGVSGNDVTETVTFTVVEEPEAPDVDVRGSGVSVTEDTTGSIGLAADVVVTDDESGLLLTTVSAASGSTLSVGTVCAGSFTGVGTNELMTASGGALSATALTQCLRTLQFRAPTNVGGTSASVTITVDDQQTGSGNGVGTIMVTVIAMDDPPTLMLTGNAAGGMEGVPYTVFAAVSLSDVDTTQVTVTVRVDGGASIGTLSVTRTGSAAFAGGTGQNEATLMLEGSAADLEDDCGLADVCGCSVLPRG